MNEPPGYPWLKGRVNKDGEYQDDEIRSVGDKLIKEEPYQVDQATDVMTLVLVKEKRRREREEKELLIKSMSPARGTDSKEWRLTEKSFGCTSGPVSLVDIHPVNSSADEEGGTTVLGCDQNDASIRKEMQKRMKLLNLWELRERLDQSERILQVKIHNPKKMCRYYHKSLTHQVTIQMITVENKTAPKVPTKRKNFYVSSDAMQKEANKKRSQKALTMFMANLSSADPVYDEAGPSYDSDVLSEVHDNDHYQDAVCKHHEIHEMHDDVQPNYVFDSHADYTSDSNMIPYDQYIKDNTMPTE
ncbi:hypothetical protein Tco_1376393 [Tanacetum coccineum]